MTADENNRTGGGGEPVLTNKRGDSCQDGVERVSTQKKVFFRETTTTKYAEKKKKKKNKL